MKPTVFTQWFSFSPYARSYTDAPHFCGRSRANVQLPRKNCCTFDLMFVLYFLWPFRLRLLRHRCCPNITVPLCRAGHSFNEKHTHFRPEEKEFARQGIAITFWWTSPNNQAPRNLIPLKSTECVSQIAKKKNLVQQNGEMPHDKSRNVRSKASRAV